MRSERIFEVWNAWTRVRAAITALFDAFERQFGLFRIRHRFRSTMRNDRRRDSPADDGRAVKTVRVFNLGGVLGLEATNRVARALRERLASRCFKVVVVADARDVDIFDDDDNGNGNGNDDEFIVFVVETAERDEPAPEARDRVKSILKRASSSAKAKSKSSR